MKRMVKANDQTAYRVISIGVDVVIPADMDSEEVLTALEDDFTAQQAGKMRVAVADFKGDVTDLYESDYPADLFI